MPGMLTKDSAMASTHPWTRVSWISGSDIDSLDEEEVQEVETNTLGRAFPDHSNSSNSNNMEAEDPPFVVDHGVTSFDDSASSAPRINTTSVPFLTSTTCESTTINNHVHHQGGLFGNTTPPSPPKEKEPLLSPVSSHLISPAVQADAHAPPDEEQEVTVSATSTRWTSFWQKTAPPEEEDAQEEEDATKEDNTDMDTNSHDLNEEDVLLPLPNLIDEDVAPEEILENDLDSLSAKLKVALLQVRDGIYQLPADIKAFGVDGWAWMVGTCLWIWSRAKAMWTQMDQFLRGTVLALWNQAASFGVRINSRIQNGFHTTQETVSQWTTAALDTPLDAPVILVHFGTLLAVILLGTIGRHLLYPGPPSPTNDLRDFVRFEKANNVVDLKEIDELNTEAFRTYARSTCVEASTFEQARHALETGLFGIPESVRKTVVRMAVMEGVTQKNSVQDSNSDFVHQGKADAFMAFWSTVYDPRGSDHSTYKTCVMVTGVALTVAETVAEWTTKQEKYQVGVEPCQCGYFYCEECPVFDVREVKWPIFERRSLSLKKQEELRRWMVDQAVKSAEHLVLDGSSDGKLKLGGESSALAQKSPLAWTTETSAAFFGESSRPERVARPSDVHPEL